VVNGGGDAGTIDVAVTSGRSDAVPNRGDASQGKAPGRTTWQTVAEYLTPACSGNALMGSDLLCTTAISSCPAPDQVRYLIWHQVTTWTAGNPDTSVVTQPWTREPGSYCLGPDDPGVPVIGRVLAAVQTEFQRLPLPTGQVRADPAPVTLVNIPTAFSVGAGQPLVFTPTVLGVPVAITARPVAWQWNFGDGSQLTTSTPGRAQHPDVTYTYTQPGDLPATVRITWAGTFTLPGSTETLTIRDPAFTQAPPTTIPVREARAQLIAPN